MTGGSRQADARSERLPDQQWHRMHGRPNLSEGHEVFFLTAVELKKGGQRADRRAAESRSAIVEASKASAAELQRDP